MHEPHLRFKTRTIVFTMLSFAGAALYFAADSGRSDHEVERLRDQNRILNAHLKALEEDFDQIKTYTSSVRALAGGEMTPTDIKERDELKLITQDPDQLGLLGRISLSAKSNSLYDPNLPRKSDNEHFADMLATIDTMSRDTEGLLRRLRALSTIVRHSDSLINRIPSLKPSIGKVTSEFGMRLSPFDGMRQFHAGLDIGAPQGAPIKAPADGVVTFVGDFDTLGNTIVLDHGASIMTRFGHIHKMLVKVGQRVKRGAVIGTVGNTGRSTGPHLHYEVWIRNQAVDPRDFFYDLTDKPPMLSRDFKQFRDGSPMGGGNGF